MCDNSICETEEVGYDNSGGVTLGSFASCKYDDADTESMEVLPLSDTEVELGSEKEIKVDSKIEKAENPNKEEQENQPMVTVQTDERPLQPSQCHVTYNNSFLYKLNNLSFMSHYISAGFISSVVLGVMLVEMVGVMALHTDMYASAMVVVASPWALRSVVGLLSDQCPIAQYRRKPYQIIGWVITTGAFVMTYIVYTEPEPYYCFDTTTHQYVYEHICNKNAADQAGLLTVLFAVVIGGIMISTSALDGLVVERSQRCEKYESPLLTTQAMWLFGSFLGRLCIASLFNDRRHMGFFESFSIDLGYLLIACIGISALMVLFSIVFSKAETKVPARLWWARKPDEFEASSCCSCKFTCRQLIAIVIDSYIFKLCMFCLLASSALGFSSPVDWAVRRYWANVQLLQQQVAWLITDISLSLILLCFKSQLMNTSWRLLLCAVIPSSAMLTMGIYTIVCMNVYRNQYVYLLSDFLDTLADSIVFCTSSMAAVSLAPKNYEATMYNLVLTLHTLPTPLIRWMCNLVNDNLPLLFKDMFSDQNTPDTYHGALSYNHNYIEDTPVFRKWVLLSFALSAAVTCSIVVTGIIYLLPEDHAEVKLTVVRFNTVVIDRCAIVRGFTFMFVCMGVLVTGVLLLFYGQDVKVKL